MWECHFSVVQLEGGGFTVSQDSTQPRIAVCNLHNQADWYHSSFPPRLAVEFDGIGLASHGGLRMGDALVDEASCRGEMMPDTPPI